MDLREFFCFTACITLAAAAVIGFAKTYYYVMSGDAANSLISAALGLFGAVALIVFVRHLIKDDR